MMGNPAAVEIRYLLSIPRSGFCIQRREVTELDKGWHCQPCLEVGEWPLELILWPCFVDFIILVFSCVQFLRNVRIKKVWSFNLWKPQSVCFLSLLLLIFLKYRHYLPFLNFLWLSVFQRAWVTELVVPGNWLEIGIFKFHQKLDELDTLGLSPRNLGFNSPSRGCWCTLRIED